MKISVVGNVLKDIYLNLDTRTESLETDQNHVKWLNVGFDTSEHHFFNRSCSLGGAAVSLEVLAKMNLPASVIGSDLKLTPDGLTTTSPVETYRYILVAGSEVSYFVPSNLAETEFSAPTEPLDYLFIDRSAHLSAATIEKICAYLDISTRTELAVYLKDPTDVHLSELINRADLIFVENSENSGKNPASVASSTPNSSFAPASENSIISNISPQRIIYLSETEFRHGSSSVPVFLSRADLSTHLSIYSIAAATILGASVLGRSLEEALQLAAANVENSHLFASLPLDELEKIVSSAENPTSDSASLELIAANLMLKGKGILAADESGGSIEKKFAQLAIPDTYENRRDYRNIFFTTPQLSQFVNGVILFDETTRQYADNGQNFVDFLTASRIIPGVKVDEGLENFENSLETYTKGLENLKNRLPEYYNRGLRFAKWRAAFNLRVSTSGAILTPTDYAVSENCRILAEYAKACQEAGLVPIVEPEVVYNGYYSLEQCATVTSHILDVLFEKLRETGVNLRACILKTNMVIAGKNYQPASLASEVGVATAKVLKRHVPEELAGVVFLSGGQTPEQATANLAEITQNGPFPWPVTFSFARALQDPALFAWRGDNENADAARAAFRERLVANTEALLQIDF